MSTNESVSTHDADDPRQVELDSINHEIEQHQGTKIAKHILDVRRTLSAWDGFTAAFDEILMLCETDEECIVELIRNIGDHSAGDHLKRFLDQSLIAYVAGLGSVIDHSRIISKKLDKDHLKEESDRRIEIFQKLPQSVFLGKLRNYVLHYLAAPWRFSGGFSKKNPTEMKITLDASELLEWKSWTAEPKRFIEEAGKNIHLRPLIKPHLDATKEHTNWLLKTVFSDNLEIIEEANEIIRRRNLLITGGATDGHDLEARMKHIEENLQRSQNGEPQINYMTGGPIEEQR